MDAITRQAHLMRLQNIHCGRSLQKGRSMPLRRAVALWIPCLVLVQLLVAHHALATETGTCKLADTGDLAHQQDAADLEQQLRATQKELERLQAALAQQASKIGQLQAGVSAVVASAAATSAAAGQGLGSHPAGEPLRMALHACTQWGAPHVHAWMHASACPPLLAMPSMHLWRCSGSRFSP